MYIEYKFIRSLNYNEISNVSAENELAATSNPLRRKKL